MQRIDKFCERFGDAFIWGLISVYTFAFCYLTYLKYFSFGFYDWDFASDCIVYWNSVHGKFLYYPFLEDNIFGAHLYLIALLIIPIYALLQHPLTVLFLQTVFLGLGAYPLYLLAKSKLNRTFALTVSLAYLLYPSLGFMNLFETHFDSFTIFFLGFALYFFEKEKFKNFIIFLVLALACKENVSLIVFMFGIYALIRRRPKRWIVVPSVLGLAWFFLAVKVIIPYFAKNSRLYQEGFMFSIFYRHLGSNIFEMMKTILFHPVAVAKYALMPRKLVYLFQLFLPTGFAGFLAPGVLLMTVPIFMQNLLSAGWTHAQIQYQYVAMLLPFIFASIIFAFKKLLGYKTIYGQRIKLLILLLVFSIASGFFLKAPQLYFRQYVKAYAINDVVREKDKLVAMIPKDASVISSFQFLPRLANRYDLYSIHFVSTGFKMHTKAKYEPPESLKYAIIDFNDFLLIGSFFPPNAPANFRSFLEGKEWRVLKALDDIVLFEKDYLKGHRLCEWVVNPEIENTLDVNIDNQVMLLGYDANQAGDAAKEGIVRFAFYWKRIGEPRGPVAFFIQFLDADGQVRFMKFHTFGYRVYPLESLPKERILKEYYDILIPPEVKSGIYKARAGVFLTENGGILPVSDRTKTDSLGRIILGDVQVL